jgi:hypothetical protein
MPKNNLADCSVVLLQAEKGSQLIIEGTELDDNALKQCIEQLILNSLNEIQVIAISNSPVTSAGVNDLLAKIIGLRSLTLINTHITDGKQLNLLTPLELKITNKSPSLQNCSMYHPNKRSINSASDRTTPSPVKMFR